MIKKQLYGHINKKFADDVRETRTVQFQISSADKDRHRSVVNMANWQIDAFNANPVVGYQHNVYGDNMCVPPNPDDVLGPGRAWLEDGPNGRVLMGEVTFETEDINPQAEKIFKKVLNGTLRATSVGFMEIGQTRMEEVKDANGKVVDQTEFYAGQELLEFSIVNIPSNRQALARSFTHHKDAALGYIGRMLPQVSINQLRKMSVQEVLDLVEKQWGGGEGRHQFGQQADLFNDLEQLEEDITLTRKVLCDQYALRVKLNANRLVLSE